jgi:hypothetical protein
MSNHLLHLGLKLIVNVNLKNTELVNFEKWNFISSNFDSKWLIDALNIWTSGRSVVFSQSRFFYYDYLKNKHYQFVAFGIFFVLIVSCGPISYI